MSAECSSFFFGKSPSLLRHVRHIFVIKIMDSSRNFQGQPSYGYENGVLDTSRRYRMIGVEVNA
jgi:hypothetical protein